MDDQNINYIPVLIDENVDPEVSLLNSPSDQASLLVPDVARKYTRYESVKEEGGFTRLVVKQMLEDDYLAERLMDEDAKHLLSAKSGDEARRHNLYTQFTWFAGGTLPRIVWDKISEVEISLMELSSLGIGHPSLIRFDRRMSLIFFYLLNVNLYMKISALAMLFDLSYLLDAPNVKTQEAAILAALLALIYYRLKHNQQFLRSTLHFLYWRLYRVVLYGDVTHFNRLYTEEMILEFTSWIFVIFIRFNIHSDQTTKSKEFHYVFFGLHYLFYLLYLINMWQRRKNMANTRTLLLSEFVLILTMALRVYTHFDGYWIKSIMFVTWSVWCIMEWWLFHLCDVLGEIKKRLAFPTKTNIDMLKCEIKQFEDSILFLNL